MIDIGNIAARRAADDRLGVTVSALLRDERLQRLG